MNTDLHEMRVAAAEASAGTSDDAIYPCIERLVRHYDLRGSILDYGAGKGNLTRRLAATGHFAKIAGADLMPRPRNLPDGIDWLEQDLNESAPLPAASYDVVVAAEVIEHLENPRSMVRDIFRILRPGGRIILTTPNNESLRSLLSIILRGHFVSFLDGSYPAHITALLRKDIERILGEAGFSRPDFWFTDVGGVPSFPTTSWQRISLGVLKGVRFSDNVLASARKPA
jgi:2-polyprenyl-3-methyl-5-hydroxy-6-metoxy-1,4-benzoquinol methylase